MKRLIALTLTAWLAITGSVYAAAASNAGDFPRTLESYGDGPEKGLMETLIGRVQAEPFNAVATGIFVLAIIHTFLASKFRHMAHEIEEAHAAKLKKRKASNLKSGNQFCGRLTR